MYPWVKAVLASFIISILAIIVFAFREPIVALFESGKSEPIAVVTEPPALSQPVIKPVIKQVTKPTAAPVIQKIIAKPVKDKTIALAQNEFDKEHILEAKSILVNYLEVKKLTADDDLFWEITVLLTKINRIIITTSYYTPEKIKHIISSGDRLSKLARTYKTTTATINKTNDRAVDTSMINLGKAFYIYAGFWSVKVIKSKYKLILFDKGIPFIVYNIADGKQNRTPEGKFIVQTKQVDPSWTAPGKNVAFGDPTNPLGTRWMGLKETCLNSQNTGYGIHGTKDPKSIGTSASNGCIRMHNSEVEELFDIIPYGVPVEIVK